MKVRTLPKSGQSIQLILSILLLCSMQGLQAQEKSVVKIDQKEGEKTFLLEEKATANKFQFIPASFLTVGGLAAYAFDEHYYNIREAHTPSFKQTYDDYTQYLPGAVMLGMKVAGVEGKSTWGEMLLSDALSATLMVGLIESTKYIIGKERPDGSAKNSFPSGHTATAFMFATMLHKEYGELSPWFSIGAYTCATATGFTRQLNKRHWMSDVLVGAGVGIISVELGYYLADLILGKTRIYNVSNLRDFTERNPSFLGMNLGVRQFWRDFSTTDGKGISLNYGSTVSMEGAYYFNKHWGIGGQTSIASNVFKLENTEKEIPLGLFSAEIGAYYSNYFSPLLRMEAKLLLGKNWFKNEDELKKEHIDVHNHIHYTTGLSLNYAATKSLAFKVFGEYSLMPYFVNNKTEHATTFGLATNLMF